MTRRASQTLRDYWMLARRALTATMRRPAAFIPALVFPIFFLVMMSSALERSTELPGFPPVESFAQFALASIVVQGAMFAAVSAGAELAIDIEGGFLERLIASPVSRSAMLVGRLTGAAAFAFGQSLLFMLIALLVGAPVESGILGAVAVSGVSGLVAAGFGSVASALALRTGSSETVQGTFPMIFAVMFLSSAFFPRNLMDGWFKTVATANPFSHLIEGIRDQIIGSLDFRTLLLSAAIATALVVAGLGLSLVALRARLAAS